MRLRATGFVLMLLPFAACSKPSDDDCRKAIHNLQKIRGLADKPSADADIEAYVRRCRSTGSTDSVRCVINAKTAAEADACLPKDK